MGHSRVVRRSASAGPSLTPGGTRRTVMRIGMCSTMPPTVPAGTCECRTSRTRSSRPASGATEQRSPCSRRNTSTRPWACTPSRHVRTPGMSRANLSRRQMSSRCHCGCAERLQTIVHLAGKHRTVQLWKLRSLELPQLMHQERRLRDGSVGPLHLWSKEQPDIPRVDGPLVIVELHGLCQRAPELYARRNARRANAIAPDTPSLIVQ
jgi:hypothetical protein